MNVQIAEAHWRNVLRNTLPQNEPPKKGGFFVGLMKNFEWRKHDS